MKKLSNFLQISADAISQKTTASVTNLIDDVQIISLESAGDSYPKNQTQIQYTQKQHQNIDDIIPLTVDNITFDRPLQNIELQESKVIQLETKVFSNNQIKRQNSVKNTLKNSMTHSRIHDIEQEKKRILEELKKLDNEITQIKKQKDGTQSLEKSKFYKKVEISDDIEAKKQAQTLIKQLHLQKMKIQEKKRKIQQKELEQRKREEEQKKKERQELQKRLKEQKRKNIEKRMEEERKKRDERRLIDKQANVLISELKKQEEIEKQRELIPAQIQQYQHRKKLLEKKNIFNVSEIQSHERKYKEMKSKEKELRRERSESIKVSHPIPKYGKNIWVERIEEEESKKREEEQIRELNKKMQLQKRMKYGDIVKNIFRSKQKKREESIEKTSKQNSQMEEPIIQKPKTPDVNTRLPQIPKSDQKRQNLTDKQFKERQASLSIIEDKKKSRIFSKPLENKQRDPQELEKLQKQKQREMQIRKQTKERLKKLENQSIDLPKPDKVKYENYMSKVKVKKSDPHDQWRKIMSNQKLSKQEKYKQMLNKASYMQNQAKIKQDLRKSGDQDAVNLYIGSIQAKLALLQKF